VLELHGLKYLGDKLHALSLRGEWQKMREVITDEELLELAQVSTYEKMPQFLREHREYAKRTTLGMRYSSPDERARAQAVMAEVRKVETSGVPRGLEIA